YTGIPVMAANMDSVVNHTSAKILTENGLFSCVPKFLEIPDLNVESFAVSLGESYGDLDKLDEVDLDFKFICIDVANGYRYSFLDFVREARRRYPNKGIIAGNVCTAEGTRNLIDAGADIVKVGVGPGSLCLTRKKTGVGVPQFSAIVECAEVA